MINPFPAQTTAVNWIVSRAVDLEDVDSHCRTTDRHGKHRRQTDAEHRRCACGKSPTQRVFADELHMLCPRQRRTCVRGHRCHRHCIGHSKGSAHRTGHRWCRQAPRRGEPSERGQLQDESGGHGHLVRFGWIGAVRLGPLLDDEAGCRLQDECATDVQQIEGRVGAPGHFLREVLGQDGEAQNRRGPGGGDRPPRADRTAAGHRNTKPA